jgi:predicted Zn-dependent protease with MMP-like domain
MDSLPREFMEKMENVYIIIEDRPTREAAARVGLRGDSMLLGLYEGVPMSKRGTSYGSAAILPDRITLFQKNIEAVVRSELEIPEKIREVLIHEIAHHFGMNEKEIRDAGY